MFDGGTRIPFMLRWPAQVKPQVSDAFICQMDLLASFAALLGQTYPDQLDSENTLDAFLGKSQEGRKELVIEGALLTMYDARTNLSNQVVKEVKNYFDDKVYKTVIPRNVKLSEAPSYGMPICMYDAMINLQKNL